MLGAAAVGAGDGRCCYWYRSASSLVVTSAPGQSVSYSFAQSSTDWFCSLSCPPVASLNYLAVCGAAVLVPASRSRIFVVSVYYFLIFVLVVCSPLLLLSGRTTGYFAGQSTAVVEILQSSAPGLVMVMMMVGNAAVAATATAANTQNSGAHEYDRLLCWPVYCCC